MIDESKIDGAGILGMSLSLRLLVDFSMDEGGALLHGRCLNVFVPFAPNHVRHMRKTPHV